jgi:hypothetical protein
MTEHPPAPGPLVTPNFLAIEEALGTVTFPIGKRDLLDILGARDEDLVPTALVNGRNVDLADLVAEMDQDWFGSEEDFRNALEARFGIAEDPDPEPLPTGPQSGWQADVGPGASGGAEEYVEPPEGL